MGCEIEETHRFCKDRIIGTYFYAIKSAPENITPHIYAWWGLGEFLTAKEAHEDYAWAVFMGEFKRTAFSRKVREFREKCPDWCELEQKYRGHRWNSPEAMRAIGKLVVAAFPWSFTLPCGTEAAFTYRTYDKRRRMLVNHTKLVYVDDVPKNDPAWEEQNEKL